MDTLYPQVFSLASHDNHDHNNNDHDHNDHTNNNDHNDHDHNDHDPSITVVGATSEYFVGEGVYLVDGGSCMW